MRADDHAGTTPVRLLLEVESLAGERAWSTGEADHDVLEPRVGRRIPQGRLDAPLDQSGDIGGRIELGLGHARHVGGSHEEIVVVVSPGVTPAAPQSPSAPSKRFA